ncbi:hypothetical protein QQF64_003406 [Cirrhinus molitorella]|uniref:Uncharacterized protein n=1 Tax=Cirrhinus molitorella TaxID=172907 RepID=A0ABR3ML72_9TELE
MFPHICAGITPMRSRSRVGFSQQRAAAQGGAAMCAEIEPELRVREPTEWRRRNQRGGQEESQMDYVPVRRLRTAAFGLLFITGFCVIRNL